MASEPRSALDIASSIGITRGTARRYLEHLAQTGRAEMHVRYGSTGRPEHLYRLAGTDQPGERSRSDV